MVTAEALPLTLDTLDITDTGLYVEHGYPWEAWDILRREAPVYWYQRPGFEPFWAITKHADIRYISSHPELFSNTQILRMNDHESIGISERTREVKANRYGGHPSEPPDFIFMDPPEHRQHRGLVARHFTPRMMKRLEDHFGEMSENYVSSFAEKLVADFTERADKSAVDVVHELSAKLPVAAICDMGGVPEEDWDQIFRWTETSAGAADPEFRLPGEDREQTIRRVDLEHSLYNEALVREREASGLGDDLLSDLLKAGDRRGAAHAARDFGLLPPADRRGQRDDAQLDHGRDQGAAGSPGSARGPGRAPRAGALGGRGDSALDVDRDSVPAHGDAGPRAARAANSQGRVDRDVVPVGEPR